MKTVSIDLVKLEKNGEGYWVGSGELKMFISGKLVKFVDKKRDCFDFDVIGTVISTSATIEKLQDNKKGNYGLMISISGQPDEHSIGIKVKKYMPTLEIELYEILSANENTLTPRIELQKIELLKELKKFLEEIIALSKKEGFYEDLKKEIKKAGTENETLKKLLSDQKEGSETTK